MRCIIFLFLIGMSAKHASAQWTGTLNLLEKYSGKGLFEGCIREKHMDLSFIGTQPSLDFGDPSDPSNNDKGIGTVTDHADFIIGGKREVCSCSGTGQAILDELSFTPDSVNRLTLRISASGPECKGSGNGDGSCGGTSNDFVIDDQPIGPNPKILSGTYTNTFTDDNGTITKTYTWHLERSFDLVLIVTPVKYDDWLPEAGKDEWRKGNFMEIDLKVQKRNGQPSDMKVKTFDLHLSNTSSEPGITLNYPLQPSANQLPDLRLLPDPRAETNEAVQYLRIQSTDGKTGKAFIGSYDGGGWTTLTVEADVGGIIIQGNLLTPTGATDILVPKRDPSTKIGEAWMKLYNYPGETDDKEESAGNTNDGDGLSAYEEYRGFIAEGEFKRLDPKVKELGVLLRKAERSLMELGLDWFKNASQVTPVKFIENEIGPEKRLNKNSSHANTYKQYVLKIVKGAIRDKKDSKAVGKTYPGPGLPESIDIIKIDFDKNARTQREIELVALHEHINLPFTLAEIQAKTVAHELGHGVNILHHGESDIFAIDDDNNSIVAPSPQVRIYSAPPNPQELTRRPYPFSGAIGKAESGNQESGDVFCIMNYNPCYSWSSRELGNERYIFYRVPLLPVGTQFCTSKDGTDFNTKDANGKNNYFGDATEGNCVGQIKLKN